MLSHRIKMAASPPVVFTCLLLGLLCPGWGYAQEADASDFYPPKVLDKLYDAELEDDPSADPNEILPFAPSIVDLPYLKLFDDGSKFVVSCQLRLHNIPTVQYHWYFSPTEDGEGREIVNSNDGLYDLTRANSRLELKTSEAAGSNEYPPGLMGFYWCRASNVHGHSQSNRMQARKPAMIQFDSEIIDVKTKTSESKRLRFDFERDPASYPFEVYFEVQQPGLTPTLLRPETSSTYKEGRFVIGSNYDLYILSPTSKDDCVITQNYRDFNTSSPHPTKTVKFTVERDQLAERVPPAFFPDFPPTYLFVRGVESHFTCIPNTKTPVRFHKDDQPLSPSSDVIAHDVYRSDYALFFPRPREDDQGRYTCSMVADHRVSISYDVRVIGPPEITCNYHELVIRSPDSSVTIRCTVHSDFMDLYPPKVFVNGTDLDLYGCRMGRACRISDSFSVTVSEQGSDTYSVVVDGTALSKFDSTVFRVEASAQQMSRSEIISKAGLGDPASVHFADYALLPFHSRKEIVLTVISRAPVIFDVVANKSVLIGSRDQKIVYSIFGSPVPTVTWKRNGTDIVSSDPDFRINQLSALEFALEIREVTGTFRYQVFAENIVSEGVSVTETHTITAHQPLVMKPSQQTRYYTVIHESVTVSCAAKQALQTGTSQPSLDIDFIWTDTDRGIQLTPMMYPLKVKGLTEYPPDALTGYTEDNITLRVEDEVTNLQCMVRLGTLDQDTLDIRIEAGERPAAPKLLRYEAEEKVFKWFAERTHSFERDFVQWQAAFSDQRSEWTHYDSTDEMRENKGAEVPIEMPESANQVMSRGTKYLFRVRTKNWYAYSGFSNTETIVLEDAAPEKMVENLEVSPDSEDGSRKIIVSWNEYARADFHQFEAAGCCIQLTVRATVPGERSERVLREACVDPRLTSFRIGWPDMHPYTEHTVEALFSNRQGATPTTSTRGYNAAARPSAAPTLMDGQPAPQPTAITVHFHAMDAADVNGQFAFYRVDVTDPDTGDSVGAEDPILGSAPGDSRSITVTGLSPYTDYDVTISVHNTAGLSTYSDPWPARTKADRPGRIDPETAVTQVFPGGVWAFWQRPVMNGEFEAYEAQILDSSNPSSSRFESTVERADLTPYFFNSDRGQQPIRNEREYMYELSTRNHFQPSDPTRVAFHFHVVDQQPGFFGDKPGGGLQKPEVECDDFLSSTIRVRWTYLDFAPGADSHSIQYRTETSDKGRQTPQQCSRIEVSAANQSCEMETEPGTSVYYIRLVGHNRFGESYSEEATCSAGGGGAASRQSAEAGMRLSPIYVVVIALLLLAILLVLGVLYWRRNRAHPYRIREKESKYRPADAESFPRKDDTHRFDEFSPGDKFPSPFDVRHPLIHTPFGPDAQSMHNFEDDDEDLDGFNEDGSFLDAYGLSSMENPILHLNTGV